MIGAIGGAEPHPLPKIVINNYVNVMMIAFKVTKALICQVKINHLKRHLLLATTNHRCQHTKSNSYKLLSYRPPDWASHLQMIPLVKVKVINNYVNVMMIAFKVKALTCQVKINHLKRHLLLATTNHRCQHTKSEALATGCQAVITCGGVQSNHCRTTAVAAKQLSIETHLLLRSREEKSIKAYSIPIGGSNVVGLHGYLCGWQELLEQGVTDRFDDVILTVGSGGTAAGVAIGNFLTGSHLRVHAFAVCDTAEYFHSHINETLNSIGLGDTVRSHDIINIHEGAKGLGYGISKPEEFEFIKTVAQQTSILLDHTYTVKSALALTNELRKHRSKFKGSRILFLHSGGIFSMFDGRLGDVQMQSAGETLVQNWMNPEDEPTIV
ncbi:putative D-cysteine desulfhydrase 1, mitochondrial [Anneissia japonica]|uniref:putative D-cysteine desulfhydrase 1, mitochondrial n=1 Tax=Anneissia japonica TaxID=1529436 RepID=UPI0014259244|nr:putative D-cysteine desulfhydrase 1, mitochondrial [Anneissia japonica]